MVINFEKGNFHNEPTNPVHITPSHLSNYPSYYYPPTYDLVFPTNNLYMCLFSPIHPTCPTHPLLLKFIILIILGEEYKSR
jgi:hypothetical protein